MLTGMAPIHYSDDSSYNDNSYMWIIHRSTVCIAMYISALYHVLVAIAHDQLLYAYTTCSYIASYMTIATV